VKNREGMSLGDLIDPEQHVEPLEVCGCNSAVLIGFLDKMIEIRRAEECIADLIESGKVATPCHLGIGQEAVAVGVASQLFSTDRVFGGHRSHSHFLSLGGSLTAMFAEILGRNAGASRGMGGSMHLYDAKIGFHGCVPIVAGTIPIAIGAALAAKMDKGSAISVCFFGDGAAEEGVLHESLNLAASQELPILFVCENNLFSSHLDIDIRQPGNRIARFADAHGIAAESVDGNDVITVQSATEYLVKNIRELRIPGFLEAITYRHRGHVGPNEDIDVGVHRTMEDVVAWKKRDPITRLVEALKLSDMIDEKTYKKLENDVARRITVASKRALCESYPEDAQLTSFVYSGR